MHVVPASAVGTRRWDEFVESSDDAWFWHTSGYRSAIETWSTRADVSCAVLDRDKIVAILPLHLVRMRLGRVVPFVELDSQGGPAFAVDIDEVARGAASDTLARHVLETGRARHATAVRIRTTPLAPARRRPGDESASLLGAVVEPALSWLSDLAGGTDATWGAMQGRARTSIRKAETSGVTVRPAVDADLETYYGLHVQTYTRTGVRPHAREYFEAIWRDVLPTGRCVVLLAEQEGVVVAAQNFAVHKEGAWYWTGAAGDAGLRSGANALLQWRGMCAAHERGARWFDHGEAFPDAAGKLRGLSDFKRSFGGVLTPVCNGTLDLSTWLWRAVAGVRDRGVTALARRPT
jgi:hypothetical protein